MDNMMLYIWIGIVIAAVIIEAITSQLVSIWFVAGAIAGALTGMFTDNVVIQLVVFLVVTAITLAATRPLVNKMNKRDKVSTNTDRFIGQNGVVTEEINNVLGQGQVVISGNVWTARSKDDSVIAKDENVKVECIEGVKLIVMPVQK